ncbi:uncharacterized protein LOC130779741 isoform X2 [Actinidia eriantha]|uniref:uncharacterized protein LOC130779741 isoform X2 n=1 Tax=Actinidia eriantha TaxID=165200 RepID=UPI002589E7C3|nr:uncharacterized protein LOC130779741 isoform X2 [Actinidia eriantha]
MEGPYGNDSSRVSKLKAFNGNVLTINSQRDNRQLFIVGGRLHHQPKSPTLDPYSENLDSALIRYLRYGSPVAGDAFKAPVAGAMISHQFLSGNSSSSGGSVGYLSLRGSSSTVSPLSAVENLETPPSRSPPVFKTPVKVEEDVLVMDGILVESVSGGRMRLSASSDSSGSSSSSLGSKSFYKTEICRSWEDSSHCRYGSKCQEEVRPLRFPTKNKSEAQTCKSYSSSGTCSYGSKCRFAHHQVMTAAISPTGPSVPAATLATTQIISPIETENSSESSSKSMSSGSVTVALADWSPLDDGIEVSLPSSASTNEVPSREAVDAYINSVLYGPSRGKRLPAFAEICPE